MPLIQLGLSQPEKRTTSTSMPLKGMWQSIFGAPDSTAGEVVTDMTAMQVSTVFACVAVLAKAVASLPLRLYRLDSDGRREATEHLLWKLLRVAPNSDMTAFSYWEQVMVSLCLCGNAYSELVRNGAGEVVEIWPLNPRATQPFRLPDGQLAYRTTHGVVPGGGPRILKSMDVLHVPLMSHDGILGMSPIAHARESIGLAMAASKFGSRFFRNFATPSLAISVAEEVDPKTKALMREEWEKLQAGSNQHRVAILDQGATIQPLSISPEDAQWIAVRQYERNEICGIFSVPPHMIGDNTKLSNANTENLNLGFVQDTLLGYIGRIEAELVRKLLAPLASGSDYLASFDLSARLRGDAASTMAAIAGGRQWGVYTANEARRMQGLNDVGPEGDVLLVPVNMVGASRLLDPEYMGSPERPRIEGKAA